jgi:hypothetical protein
MISQGAAYAAVYRVPASACSRDGNAFLRVRRAGGDWCREPT